MKRKLKKYYGAYIEESKRDKWFEYLLDKEDEKAFNYLASGDSIVIIHRSDEGLQAWDCKIVRHFDENDTLDLELPPAEEEKADSEGDRLMDFFFPKQKGGG